MGQEAQIREGQFYVKVFSTVGPALGWLVESICVPVRSAPHARLVNVEDPLDVRMFSCETLADDRYFQLISEPRGNAGAQDAAPDPRSVPDAELSTHPSKTEGGDEPAAPEPSNCSEVMRIRATLEQIDAEVAGHDLRISFTADSASGAVISGHHLPQFFVRRTPFSADHHSK